MFSYKEIEGEIKKGSYLVSASDVFDYWQNKNWLTKKGTHVKTISAAVNVCNSLRCMSMKGRDVKITAEDINVLREALRQYMESAIERQGLSESEKERSRLGANFRRAVSLLENLARLKELKMSVFK